MLTQNFFEPEYISNGAHPSPPPRAEALPPARPGQSCQPSSSEPPGATNTGFPIRISQGVHHLAWQARWHNVPRRTQAYLALPAPPDGKPVPVVKGASGGPRQATATVVRLVTGHAFVGSSTTHFHPCKRNSCLAVGLTPRLLSTSSKSAHATKEPGPPTSPR